MEAVRRATGVSDVRQGACGGGWGGGIGGEMCRGEMFGGKWPGGIDQGGSSLFPSKRQPSLVKVMIDM